MAGLRTSCASSLVVLRSVAPCHAARSLVVNEASRFTLRSTSDHSSSTTRERTSRPCSVSEVASCCSHRWLTMLAPDVSPDVVWVARKRPKGLSRSEVRPGARFLPLPVPAIRADHSSTGRVLPREETLTVPPMAADHIERAATYTPGVRFQERSDPADRLTDRTVQNGGGHAASISRRASCVASGRTGRAPGAPGTAGAALTPRPLFPPAHPGAPPRRRATRSWGCGPSSAR